MEHIITFPSEPMGKLLGYSKRRVAIMSALATGWLPWGVEWQNRLPLCGGYALLEGDRKEPAEYILCCGHVLKRREAQLFADAGLVKAGAPDKFGRPTLVITDRGRGWLEAYW